MPMQMPKNGRPERMYSRRASPRLDPKRGVEGGRGGGREGRERGGLEDVQREEGRGRGVGIRAAGERGWGKVEGQSDRGGTRRGRRGGIGEGEVGGGGEVEKGTESCKGVRKIKAEVQLTNLLE